ncbi:hypothetical protein [Rufibacter sp. LB8]|uniref:hypothetical protein n=1 Tax=Rufibacter sp. LB8 TaxID=2777781 RepID=UPI00178C51A9|nr:hypothetical protein [Rufibacter sp. LB8]
MHFPALAIPDALRLFFILKGTCRQARQAFLNSKQCLSEKSKAGWNASIKYFDGHQVNQRLNIPVFGFISGNEAKNGKAYSSF